MQGVQRWSVTAGVVLVVAGVIAAAPVDVRTVHAPDIRLAAGDAQDIVIDIVRHGQRMPPQNNEVTPSPDHPGGPLSDLGQHQANTVGHQLFTELGGPNGVAGIFSGQAIRDQDTAAPFAGLEHMGVQILPGLNEIDSGIYANAPLDSLRGFLYQVTPLMWSLLGLVLVPMPGAVEDPNGVVMNDKFTDAVNTMYQAAMANPVVSATGHITDVAFNNEADVAAWVALNVKNPDISFLLPLTIKTILAHNDGMPLLPNTGIIQIEGNPTDGWTLVNWNGTPIPPNPDLLTQLAMDLRSLVETPQTALWHLWEALQGGGPAPIDDVAGALSNLGTDTGALAALF